MEPSLQHEHAMTSSSPMMTAISLRIQSRSLLAAVFLVLLIHLPMLFSDTILWDSAIIKHVHDTQDYEPYRLHGSLEGNTHIVESHIAVGRLPGAWRFYRIVAFACMGLIVVGLYQVLIVCSIFSPQEAALITALSLMFPSLVLWQEPIMIFQPLSLAAFWCAAAWRIRQIRNGRASLIAHFFTTLLFIVGLITESLLVFQYVLFSYLFLTLSPEWTWRRGIVFVRDNLWYLVLPVLYFFGKRMLTQAHGRLAGYNSLRPSDLPYLLTKGWIVNVKRMVLDQLVDLARFIENEPLFFLALSAVALLATAAIYSQLCRSEGRRLSFRTAAAAIGFAAFAYAAAVFPYAAVNKFPLLDQFVARHATLTYLPLSAALVILLRFLFADRRVGGYLSALALGLLILLTLRSEIRLQNQYIKVLGIVENLRGQEAQLTGVVVFQDQTGMGIKETLRTYELGWMMHTAFGNRRHLGLDNAALTADSIAEWDSKEEYKAIFYRDYQFDGTASRVVVDLAAPKNDGGTYCTYLSKSAEDRKQYARSLIRLRIQGPQPWNQIVAESAAAKLQLDETGKPPHTP